jgi:hypothetical protein
MYKFTKGKKPLNIGHRCKSGFTALTSLAGAVRTTLVAKYLPFRGSCSTSNSTLSSLYRYRKPFLWMFFWWTKISAVPSSGVMKPNPLSVLKSLIWPVDLNLLTSSAALVEALKVPAKTLETANILKGIRLTVATCNKHAAGFLLSWKHHLLILLEYKKHLKSTKVISRF